MMNRSLFSCLLGLLWLGLVPVQAQDYAQWFTEGNNAYTVQDYPNAIMWYDSVVDAGYASSALYYNLGNAHYRSGHLAPAILNYERALRLDPDHEDAQFNLRLANLGVIDNIEPQPEFLVMSMWKGWIQSLSSGQWATWAIISIWLALGLAAVFLFVQQPILKRVGFFGGILALLGSFLFLGMSLSQRSAETQAQEGIIQVANAYVKASPDGSAQDLVILHAGVKTLILREVGEWTEVKISDVKIGEVVGWVSKNAIEAI